MCVRVAVYLYAATIVHIVQRTRSDRCRSCRYGAALCTNKPIKKKLSRLYVAVGLLSFYRRSDLWQSDLWQSDLWRSDLWRSDLWRSDLGALISGDLLGLGAPLLLLFRAGGSTNSLLATLVQRVAWQAERSAVRRCRACPSPLLSDADRAATVL